MNLSLKNTIKQRFYREYYFQRWRGYLENFPEGKKKFALLNTDFERKGLEFKKDQFVTKQMPYILVGSTEDVNAINEQQKAYLNSLFPMISADQSMKQVCRDIFKRLCYRKNGLQPNIINGIVPYSPSERQAMKYVSMVNMGYKPKSIFSNPNADYFTLRLYMQKADDGEIKDEILNKLDELLLELGEGENMDMMQGQQMANSAANIMMAQNAQQAQGNDLITRQNLQSNSINE